MLRRDQWGVSDSGGMTGRELAVWIGVGSSITLVLCIMVAGVLVFRKCRNVSADRLDANLISSFRSGGKGIRVIPLKELRKATNNFSVQSQIGVGGFGKVYRGVLDGELVAIKKSERIRSEEARTQIMNEVQILSNIHHRNLVRLLGFCLTSKIALLVLEYIPQGTLAEHLHGRRGRGLNWSQRLRIALQTAEALDYLHTAADPPIYHRDVKCSNILLDHKLNAKVADFGISTLVPIEATHVTTYAIKGTPGYMDPDFYISFQMTAKCDVYSFGVVMLELITGQAPLDLDRGTGDGNLVNMTRHLLQKEVLDDLMILDPALRAEQMRSRDENFTVPILKMAHLALKCVRQAPFERPTMKKVVSALAAISGCSRSRKSFKDAQNHSTTDDSKHDEPSASRSAGGAGTFESDTVAIRQDSGSEISIEILTGQHKAEYGKMDTEGERGIQTVVTVCECRM